MPRHEAVMLYTRLRQELLSAAAHHRRAARHPALLTEAHRSQLSMCQRQLGALRQAYRRTQETVAWEQYKRQLGSRA